MQFLSKLILATVIFSSLFTSVSAQAPTTEQQTLDAPVYELFPAEVLKINKADPNNPEAISSISVKPSLPELKFQTLNLNTTNLPDVILNSLQPGDQILVENFNNNSEDQNNYQPIDFFRNTPMLVLLSIFVVLVLVIARKKGLAAILALVASFFIVFFFTIKQITSGADPILISLLTALIIIPINFYFTHGINRKTHSAVLATFITMSITIIFADFFVNWARLTGLASDEAFWVTQNFQDISNLRGLLIGGIMLGMVGVLDDVSVGQAGIVNALLIHSKEKKVLKIYNTAMNLGRDHIASVVNTLILVYTSASLPLLILFSAELDLLGNLVSLEIISEEIIRTLITSIGLILAVPITTFISIKLLQNNPFMDAELNHHH
ncbi:MAG: YibE/F family protein [Candidatus Altimarinota bacterium]